MRTSAASGSSRISEARALALSFEPGSRVGSMAASVLIALKRGRGVRVGRGRRLDTCCRTATWSYGAGPLDAAVIALYDCRCMIALRDLDRLNAAVHALLLRLNVARLDLWSDKLAGIGYLDLHAMSFVEEKPEHTLAELRTFLQIPQSTLTSLISRLEEKGLVRRQVHPTDKRSYRIELTEKGNEIQLEHHRVERLMMRKLLEALPDPEDRSKFVELFLRAAKNLSP